jgi:hypothetical protein
MYKFASLLPCLPALWFQSGLGLLAAINSYVVLWVHWYCTEQPDMMQIYGGGNGRHDIAAAGHGDGDHDGVGKKRE